MWCVQAKWVVFFTLGIFLYIWKEHKLCFTTLKVHVHRTVSSNNVQGETQSDMINWNKGKEVKNSFFLARTNIQQAPHGLLWVLCWTHLKFLTLLIITQNNYSHKTSLGNESWGDIDSIKHCEKRLPLMNWSSFRLEVVLHEFDFETSDLE